MAKKKCRYTVYENRNDCLVIKEGTAEACAEVMGISVQGFHSAVRESRSQEFPKWDITVIKWCVECGQKLEQKKGTSNLCSDCKAAVGKWDEEFKAKKKALKEAKKKRRSEEARKVRELRINKKKCATCLYRMQLNNERKTWYCGYCYYTGHKRPCEVSPSCVAYEKFDDEKRKCLEKNLKNSG